MKRMDSTEFATVGKHPGCTVESSVRVVVDHVEHLLRGLNHHPLHL